MKYNIMPIDTEEALRVVLGLRPVTFCIKGTDKVDMGFIAQEVIELESTLPLYGEKDGFYSLPYTNYTSPLAGSVQALYNRIIRLEDVVYAN